MRELRQNPVTGTRVVVAPGRSRRPRETLPGMHGVTGSDLPERDPGCPFCPGNEDQLPAVVWEDEASGEPGWRVRAAPNLYPAFAPDDGKESPPVPGMHAAGRQEVIIETPRHDRDPSRMTAEELRRTMRGYQARARALAAGGSTTRIFPFRNQGAAAGASLVHPHGQIIAMEELPASTRQRETCLREHYGQHRECLLCSLPGAMPGGSERTVLVNDHVIAFVPWAAEAQYEVWLVPRAHEADFCVTSDEARDHLADALGSVLRRLRTLAGEAAYNWMLHSAAPADSADPALHWFLQLRPRLAQPAGFELATGIGINPSSPEADAEELRGAPEASVPERDQVEFSAFRQNP